MVQSDIAANSKFRVCSVPCDYCDDKIKKYEVYCVYRDKITSDTYWVHLQCEDNFKSSNNSLVLIGDYKNASG